MSKIKYKVTQQYAKDEEKPIAEFFELSDANFFIERKTLSDSEKLNTLIYRLFNDQKLVREFNKEKINASIRPGQYVTGDRDLPSSIGPFKVTKDQSATQLIAAFSELANAELFMEDKLTQSSGTYYLFKDNKLITKMDEHVKKQFQDETTQGKGQSSSFRPTPLNTTPRPPGSPPAWIKDNDEDEDKK